MILFSFLLQPNKAFQGTKSFSPKWTFQKAYKCVVFSNYKSLCVFMCIFRLSIFNFLLTFFSFCYCWVRGYEFQSQIEIACVRFNFSEHVKLPFFSPTLSNKMNFSVCKTQQKSRKVDSRIEKNSSPMKSPWEELWEN